jgi:hypothetical protein
MSGLWDVPEARANNRLKRSSLLRVRGLVHRAHGNNQGRDDSALLVELCVAHLNATCHLKATGK